METYMDHAAARPVDLRVLEAMKPYFSESYGNPSSFYSKGFEALKALNEARRQVASLIGAQDSEIVFTSGATESNNLAIIGAALRYRKRGTRVVISEIEHISVINISKELTRQGYEVKNAPVDSEGVVDMEQLKELVNDDTVLVSIMAANGEIGTIQPIEQAAKKAHDHGAPVPHRRDRCSGADAPRCLDGLRLHDPLVQRHLRSQGGGSGLRQEGAEAQVPDDWRRTGGRHPIWLRERPGDSRHG